MTEPVPQRPQTQPQPQPQHPNTVDALLTLASSGDNWVKLATIGLIGLTGLGNWFATNQNALENRAKIEQVREQAASEIHELYRMVRDSSDEFHKNSQDTAHARATVEQNARDMKDGIDTLKTVLSNHSRILENQADTLKTQQQILTELKSKAAPP